MEAFTLAENCRIIAQEYYAKNISTDTYLFLDCTVIIVATFVIELWIVLTLKMLF